MTRRSTDVVVALQDLAASVAFGAFAASLVFDLYAQRSSDQFIYSRGAYLLICIGLLAGVVAAVLVAVVAGLLPRGSAAFRTAVRLIVAGDLVLLWFAVSWYQRQSNPFLPAELWVSAVSGLAVLVLAALRWQARSVLGARAVPQLRS